MCHQSNKEMHNECKGSFSKEPKCCSGEKPDSEEKRQHMKECVDALRRKADFIEKKL